MATPKPYTETHPHFPLIETLAKAVANLRHQQRLSRRALAQRSGLSERFIADVERRAANPSLLTLAQLAHALGTTVPGLFSVGALLSPGSPASQERVSREDRPRSAGQLEMELSRPAASRVIALVGMRGAGKSTVGALLAEELGCPFIELDKEIEDEAELSLSQIFEIHGEEYYRRLERQAVSAILSRKGRSVLATGGGLVTNEAAWNELRSRCLTIWLRARPREYLLRVLQQGDLRPVKRRPHALKELEALLASREKSYRQADLSVLTSGTDPRALARKLPAMIRLHDEAKRRRRRTLAAGNV